MSNKNGNPANNGDNSDAVFQPWVDYWMNLYEQNTQWTQELMAGAPPNVDPATIRKQWLGAMSNSIEAYMRSPTFLEGMKRQSEAMTATKVTSELAKLEMAREAGIPHIEDISGLYDRLETANEVVLQRLKMIETRMEARLDAIEAKLESKSKEQE